MGSDAFKMSLHGAFKLKKDAEAKAKKIKGAFVKRVKYPSGFRYVVYSGEEAKKSGKKPVKKTSKRVTKVVAKNNPPKRRKTATKKYVPNAAYVVRRKTGGFNIYIADEKGVSRKLYGYVLSVPDARKWLVTNTAVKKAFVE